MGDPHAIVEILYLSRIPSSTNHIIYNLGLLPYTSLYNIKVTASSHRKLMQKLMIGIDS